jgi:REP element-mobilizing transposase RayT
MPRQLRVELAGGIHHVTSNCPSGRILFHDDRDRRCYLQLVAREVRKRHWGVLTFCLMTNHIHLLVHTPNPDLGAGIKRIHESFARYINGRHELRGHLFGSRFYNGLVLTDRHLMGCLRYIARNPVRHGACEKPGDWPWSAHLALAGAVSPPSFLDVAGAHRYFGDTPEQARLGYLSLVAQSDDDLLSDLARLQPDHWLLTAMEAYLFSVPQIADFLGTSVRTAHRRIAAARDGKGTVPFASAEGGADRGADGAVVLGLLEVVHRSAAAAVGGDEELEVVRAR